MATATSRYAEFGGRELPRLEGVIAGGHEHDLVQPELQESLFRGDEVGDVDGIERTTHYSELEPLTPAQAVDWVVVIRGPLLPRSDRRATRARRHVYLMWPLPVTTYFIDVSSLSASGPRAWSFCVEIPISAPRPNTPPSVNRVEALM